MATKKKAAKKKTAAKKTVTKAAAKTTAAAPVDTRKLAGTIHGMRALCQPCTWGFEANLDFTNLTTRQVKVTVEPYKDAQGKVLRWTGDPDNTPILKFTITEV